MAVNFPSASSSGPSIDCRVQGVPVHIRRIIVANHRDIPDLDLEVRNHLVLVGPNSSGKTSLLRVLDLSLTGNRGQLYGGFTLESFRDPDQPVTVEVHFDNFTDLDRASMPDEINIVVHGDDQRTESLELVVAVTKDEDAEIDIQRFFRKPGDNRRVLTEHLNAISWSLLPATRSPERELGVARRSALRTLVSSINLASDTERLVELLAEANSIVDNGADAVRLRQDLAAELSAVLPQPIADKALTIQVTNVDSADPIAGAEMRIRHDDGGARPLHHQSDGTRALFSIVVQRLAEPTSIVAIDEPEIHLHPRSQARLAHLLASGPGQRIVATHAAAILAAFDPVDVIGIADGVSRQISQTSVQRDPNFFTQWWTDAAVEPLTSRVVVLVEGPSDRAILTRAARVLGYDLDQNGCSIVVAHGATTFKTLLKLYGQSGFGLNVVGLVDEAEAPILWNALGCKADIPSLRATGFEVSSPDLEGECVVGLGVERHAQLLCSSGHYNEKQLLGANKVSSTADLDPASYSKWCRGDKILHAAALASSIEAVDAEKLTSIVALLELIRR